MSKSMIFGVILLSITFILVILILLGVFGKGPKGDTGSPGASSGIAGPQGPPGPQGEQGPQGQPPEIGSIFLYAGNVEPTQYGYLFCNGQAISQTIYSNLYSIINDLYHTNAAAGTFNLPDLTDRIPIGATDAGTDGSPGQIATTGGSSTAILDITNLPKHAHQFTYGNSGKSSDNSMSVSGTRTKLTEDSLFDSNGTEVTTSKPFSIRDKYLTLNYIIYTGVTTESFQFLPKSYSHNWMI